MPVNAATHIQPKNPTSELTQQKPVTAQQSKLFSTQVETNKSNNKLQHAADHSGLSTLANADNIDNWHSLMGQTYGYDQGDSDSEAYKQSEAIREMVSNNDWSGLGVDIAQVTNGDLGAAAAFVGGDTADARDDQILLGGKPSEASNDAITEELFHAFEREINAGQEGDTRLVNGEVSFTAEGSAGALDEGELGRTLLSQFKESGTVPVLSESVLATGGITADDTSSVVLNGTSTSLENMEENIEDPAGSEDVEDAIDEITDPDDSGGSGYITAWGIMNDSDEENEYLNFAQNGPATINQLNSLFTDDLAIVYDDDGNRDYTAMKGTFSDVWNDTNTPSDWFTTLTPEQVGSQGVQDFLGWVLQLYPTGNASININTAMSDGAGAAFLENFTVDQLNYSEAGVGGTKINPEVLQHFPAEELLGLSNNKSMTASVQDALGLKIRSGQEGAEEVSDALLALGDLDVYEAQFTDAELENLDDDVSVHFDYHDDHDSFVHEGTGARNLDAIDDISIAPPGPLHIRTDDDGNQLAPWDAHAFGGAGHARNNHAVDHLEYNEDGNANAGRFYLGRFPNENPDNEEARNAWEAMLTIFWNAGTYLGSGSRVNPHTGATTYNVDVHAPFNATTAALNGTLGLRTNDDGEIVHPINGDAVNAETNPMNGVGVARPGLGEPEETTNLVRYVFNDRGELNGAYPIHPAVAHAESTFADGTDPFDPFAIPAPGATQVEIDDYNEKLGDYAEGLKGIDEQIEEENAIGAFGFGALGLFGGIALTMFDYNNVKQHTA